MAQAPVRATSWSCQLSATSRLSATELVAFLSSHVTSLNVTSSTAQRTLLSPSGPLHGVRNCSLASSPFPVHSLIASLVVHLTSMSSSESRTLASGKQVSTLQTEDHVLEAMEERLEEDREQYELTGEMPSPFSFQHRMGNAAKEALEKEGDPNPDSAPTHFAYLQHRMMNEMALKGSRGSDWWRGSPSAAETTATSA